ncbi:hypothetical protein ACIQVE_28730, partial [Pseudomonas sp. NPDC098747]|uniref:hypothetical protein n=1 Tax=Pseudomonas sp. NPDC098747 TaxID=3364487 RepID=UPI00383B84AC
GAFLFFVAENKTMSLPIPVYSTYQISRAADAFNAWLPCPFRRAALLGWTENTLVIWAMTRQVRPDLSDAFVLGMARKQYREWIKGNGDYQLMAPVARQSAPQLANV